MHAAMHANSSSSLAHIERKHKRSSRGFAAITIAGYRRAPSSRRFGALPRFSFDKVEIHETRQQVETPFHSHIGGQSNVYTARGRGVRSVYPQFNCINTRRHERLNDSIKDKTQIYKVERARARRVSLLRFNKICAQGQSSPR